MFRITEPAAIWVTLLATVIFPLTAPEAVAQTAHYQVTFETTWTAESHPDSYPPSPHFSGLVGGTHDGSVSFWQEGMPASLGIKRMAEWGSQTDLLAEVQAAIDTGQATSALSGEPLWDVPGATSLEIALSPDFSLVTLVAMIAPSPDWFVGVDSLDLMAGGNWAEEIVVDLYPWDAGTDSGTGYTSGDLVTSPPVPIFAITGDPFTPGVPLGTFTFTKLYVSAVPAAPGLSATAFPNPFNPQTTIAWELPRSGRMTLEIFDVKGRRVRTLHDRETPSGTGRAVWDGRDHSGRRVTSGQYHYVIGTGQFRLTRKLTLIK